MNIVLYNNTSDRRVINKTKTAIQTITCKLLDDCSVINPKFVIAYSSGKVGCNYVYAADFSRYYFVDNIIFLSGNRLQLECSVDVLESFKTQILNLECIISRNTNVYNKYLDDPLFQSLNKNQVQTKLFPSTSFNPESLGSGSHNFVLTVAGG